MADPELGYSEALEELESILVDLDDDELDVDALATKVERAAALVRLCRARISGARMQVDEIVAGLDDEDDG